MGLFNIFKNGKQSADDSGCELAKLVRNNCITAIEYANEFNVKLDYSKSSIENLEEILDFYSKDIPISKPTDNQIWSLSIIFGSYLGETILKNYLAKKEYVWGTDNSSDIPLLIGKDGSCLTPIDKVYKRLVNGSEDSVVSFYRFAVISDNQK